MKKLPRYKMTLKDDKHQVYIMSLVDEPAVEVNWLKFNKQTQPVEFRIQDEQRQIILSAALIPDKVIYRNNKEHGEYEIFIDAPTIRQTVERFLANKNHVNVDIEHNGELVDGVLMQDCFISDLELGIENPKGFEDLPSGTWFVSYHVTDNKLWERIKNGEVNGFSITGLFDFSEVSLNKADEKPKTKLQAQRELRELIRSML